MGNTDRIALTVPARSEYARTVRLTAGELASRVGMTIDDVDDVKLAVEEAFVFSCSHAKGDDVALTFLLDAGSVEVVVGPVPDGGAEGDGEGAEGRYARFILESICDEFETVERDGEHFLRLVKKTG
jgi:serine/threonine-protein kinase RsbW